MAWQPYRGTLSNLGHEITDSLKKFNPEGSQHTVSCPHFSCFFSLWCCEKIPNVCQRNLFSITMLRRFRVRVLNCFETLVSAIFPDISTSESQTVCYYKLLRFLHFLNNDFSILLKLVEENVLLLSKCVVEIIFGLLKFTVQINKTNCCLPTYA